MKRAFNIIGRLLVGIIILVIGSLLVIRIPKVQNWMLERALGIIEKNIDATISFDEIHFQPVSAVLLTGVKVMDSEQSVIEAGTIYANFTLRGLAQGKGLHFSKIYISDINADLVLEKGDYPLNLLRCFRIKSSPDKKKGNSDADIFNAGRVEIYRADIGIRSQNDSLSMRWRGDLSAGSLSLSGGIFSGKLLSLALEESGGYRITRGSAAVQVGGGRLALKNVALSDIWSEISLKSAEADLKNFNAALSGLEAHLDTQSAEYFIHNLPVGQIDADITISRALANRDSIFVGGVRVSSPEFGLRADLDAGAGAYRSLDSAMVSLDLRQAEFTTAGLAGLLSRVGVQGADRIASYARGQELSVSAALSGTAQMLKAQASAALAQQNGTVEIDLRATDMMKFMERGEAAVRLNVSSLDIGKILGQAQVGKVSLNADAQARMRSGMPQKGLVTLDVDAAELLGQTYRGLGLRASLEDGIAAMTVDADDDALYAHISAGMELLEGDKGLRANAMIGIPRFILAGTDTLSMLANATAEIIKDTTAALLKINNISLSSRETQWASSNIVAEYVQEGSETGISLNSEMIDASFDGSMPLDVFVQDLLDATGRRDLPSLFSGKEKARKTARGGYSARLDFHDTRDLFSYILPGLYISDGSSMEMQLDENGGLELMTSSRRVAFDDKYLKDLELRADNRDGRLSASISGSELSISGTAFEHPTIAVGADGDSLQLRAGFANSAANSDNAQLAIDGKLFRDRSDAIMLDLHTIPSMASIGGNLWNVRESDVHVDAGGVKVSGLKIDSGEQVFSLDGAVAYDSTDTLSLNLNDFDISFINDFTGRIKFDLQSRLTGRVMLMSPVSAGKAGLLVSLNSEKTSVAGTDLGTIRAAANIDAASRKLVAVIKDVNDKGTAADIKATYGFADKSISGNVRFKEFNLGWMKPLLKGVFSDFNLSLSGDVYAEGSLDDMKVSSRGCRIVEGSSMTVEFTHVPYNGQGTVHVDNNGLHFDSVTLTDAEDGRGNLRGGIYWDTFKNPRLGIDIALSNAKAIALSRLDATQAGFYGEAYANGRVRISGPFNDVHLDIDATTAKTGNFHLPLNNKTNKLNRNILTFKQPEIIRETDPYDEMMDTMKEKKQRKVGDLHLGLNVSVGQEVTAFIEIDDNGNGITANGNGDISVNLGTQSGEFSLGGDYIINEGTFHFGVLGLVSRNFTLQNGSSLKFGGNVLDTDLDIDAVYSLKTSIAPLISDTTAVANRRTVNCGIGITDKIRNPQLQFSVEVPDLDPSTQSLVESALSTQDKIDKQFVALLVTNSFLPDEQSGITSSTTTQSTLYSSMSNMMSGQINNIMQRLNIPLDLGLNYQATEGGTDIFDVALSTQLLDNRIIVSGNVGNRQDRSSAADGEMMGNLDVEFKVDKSGNTRLLLFSHAADSYTNYLDNSQRNGAGITYQKEFYSLGEFLRDLFTPKSRRARQAEESTEEQTEETFSIQSDNVN